MDCDIDPVVSGVPRNDNEQRMFEINQRIEERIEAGGDFEDDEDDSSAQEFAEALASMDEMLAHAFDTSEGGDYTPWPSRNVSSRTAASSHFSHFARVFLIHTLTNIEGARFTRRQLQILLILLTRWRGGTVPKMHHFRQVDIAIREAMPTESKVTRQVGEFDHVFFTNSIASALKLDFANPRLRQAMTFYPRQGAGLCEIWDGEKFTKELGPRHLTPSAVLAGRPHPRCAYVDEIVRLSDVDGSLVLLQRFFLRRDSDAQDHLVASGLRVRRDEVGCLFCTEDSVVCPASDIDLTGLELVGEDSSNATYRALLSSH
jgi:hypothetical protein